MVDSRILFFAPHGNLLKDGVLHSQFLSMASYLQTKGAQCLVVGLCGLDDNPKDVADFILEKFGLVAFVYPFEIVRFSPVKNRRLPQNLLKAFAQTINAFSPTHVYARTPRALLAVSSFYKNSDVKTIYDARGVITAEYLMTLGRKNFAYYDVKFLEKRAFLKADRLACVTECLAQYIQSVSHRKVDAIIPCCVTSSTQVSDTVIDRSHLGFTADQKIFCYAGGTSKWQRAEDIVSLCEKISKIEPTSRFLFISKDTAVFSRLADFYKLDPGVYQTISCSQGGVQDYLKLCNVGIILRNDNLVNNAASPIKIGEYLKAGLPVLLSNGIGDSSVQLPNRGIGFCVEENFININDVVKFVTRADSAKIRDICHEYIDKRLSWKSHVAEFERLYGA